MRRMFAALGHRITALHRSAIGNLRLRDMGLLPGEVMVLNPAEVAAATLLVNDVTEEGEEERRERRERRETSRTRNEV